MWRENSGVAAFAGVLLAGSGAAGQQAPPGLAAYIARPEHQAAVVESLRPYLASVPSCNPASAKRVGVKVLMPITLDASGALTAGALQETIKVEGCDTSGVFNILTLSRDAATPTVGALLPGTTLASSVLERDSLPTARAVASAKIPGGCADLHVIDTHFDGYGEVVNADAPGPDRRQWRETWTLLGCAQRVTVGVRYVPDRTGTSFSAVP